MKRPESFKKLAVSLSRGRLTNTHMNKVIEEKFDEEFWDLPRAMRTMANDGHDTIARTDHIKSFFDSQIKQVAEEIREMKFLEVGVSEEGLKRKQLANQCFERAAKHLESLI